MDIFEWTEQIPVTANNLNEMQNIINDNITDTIETNVGKVLWENTNPQAISTMTITLNSSDYDYYEILYTYGNSTSSTAMLSTGKILKGYGTSLQFAYYSGGIQLRKRDITYTNETSLSVSASNGSDVSTQNMIPRLVLGYKFNI